MRILHVIVEQGDGWLVAQGLEEPDVITQAKSFDALLANVREVVELLLGETDVQIELIVPPAANRPIRHVNRRPIRKSQVKQRWKSHV